MGTTDYEELYESVAPSVASVYRTGDGDGRGAGSGFLYDAESLLTNEHVLRGVESADVRFADGTWTTGQVAGLDRYTDLAVVQLSEPASLPALPIADAPPAPGTPVAALGNPLGLEGSITTGVVSGRDRSMATTGGFTIPDVVQTDAAINPGNSGGPLVAATDDGYRVIGVNRARTGDGIGFAVSSRLVAEVVPTLVDRGRYRHPYLRVKTVDVTPTVAEANGLDEPRGVLVVGVRGPIGGDALRASDRRARRNGGVVPVGGDVIVAIAGEPVPSHETLTRLLMTEANPGEPVAIEVIRNGHRQELTVEPAVRPVTNEQSVPIRVG